MKTPKIKRLEIEWKHFAVGNATCERCGNTGDALREAVEELRREFAPAGVKINLTETLLDKTRMAESNEIRMNSMLIEDLLAAGVISTDCPSTARSRERAPVAGQSGSIMNSMRIYRYGQLRKQHTLHLEFPYENRYCKRRKVRRPGVRGHQRQYPLE